MSEETKELAPVPSYLANSGSFWLEWKRLSYKLQNYHSIFFKMWSYGKPVVTNQIPTAAVTFDKEGTAFKFLINPDFWATLNDYDKCFVICHECLHILLNHGRRAKGALGGPMRDLANIAMDLSTNHMLEDHFQFDRNRLSKVLQGGMFNETFYPAGTKYNNDDFYEQHYNRIVQLIKEDKIKVTYVMMDDHSMLCPNEDNNAEQALGKIAKELSGGEKNKLVNALKNPYAQAGDQRGLAWLDINVARPRRKRRWCDLVKKVTEKERLEIDDREENFMNEDRKYTFMEQVLNGAFLLPGENTTYLKKKERRRIKIFLYLDVSGSCVHLKDDFFIAARTLPREVFDVRGFTFDTAVEEVNIYTDKIVGGGGTSFSIIEESVKEASAGKYPKCVFIFTDGQGDQVRPIHPERWYWFLTPEGTHSKECIPGTSNIYLLEDFTHQKLATH